MQDYQNKGWVRLYRKIEDNDLWLAEPFTRGQAWVDILLLANHKPRSVFIRGNEVKIERGQFIHSEDILAKRWRWSREKTRSFLAMLEKQQMLDNRKSRICSIRTVVNYLEYQETEQQTRQQNVQQKNIRPDIRPDTNKNGKNVRMERMEETDSDSDVALRAPTPAEEARKFFEDTNGQEQIADYLHRTGIDLATAQKEIRKFVSYWTEPTRNGKKQRWETEKTFEVKRRFVTWINNNQVLKSGNKFNQETKGIRI